MMQCILIYFKFFFHFEEILKIALEKRRSKDTLKNSKDESLDCDCVWTFLVLWEDISKMVFLKNLHKEILIVTS